MIFNPEEFKERIILYLNGRLSEKEREIFEETLKEDPERAREFREFLEIKEGYGGLEEGISIPSEALYERILKNIQPQIMLSLTPSRKGFFEKVEDLSKWVFHSPHFSWGIVAVQLALILFLLIAIPKENVFKTFTLTKPIPAEGVKINIVFNQEAKEKEIRELIHKIGGTIVSGPSLEGLYVIEIKEGKDIEKVLTHLKESGIINFVEKASF